MKYRAVVRRGPNGSFVVLQRKERFWQPWQYFAEASSLEEADDVMAGLATGTVTTGIWNYDKSGKRIYESWL